MATKAPRKPKASPEYRVLQRFQTEIYAMDKEIQEKKDRDIKNCFDMMGKIGNERIKDYGEDYETVCNEYNNHYMYSLSLIEDAFAYRLNIDYLKLVSKYQKQLKALNSLIDLTTIYKQ